MARARGAAAGQFAVAKEWVYRPARVCWLIGTSLLKGAATASGFVVAHHFGASLPGCGPTAGCAKLQNSEWGSVPWIGWPIAFVGIAYFVAMMAAFALSHKGVPWTLRVLAWAGAAASVGLIGVMVYLGEFCLYCALTHAFNLLFVGFLEAFVWLDRRARREGGIGMKKGTGRMARSLGLIGRVPAWGAFVVVFAATSAVLGVVNARHEAAVARSDEAERAESTRAIIAKSAADAGQPTAPADRWGANGFTGRYRKGPEEAVLRFVVLTDYQCPDCKRVEREIEEILAEQPGASLSVKHFPMCTDCNKYAGRTIHANACMAARAAEAAGILGGDEAFFKMHDWLFSVSGRFLRQEDLEPGARAVGMDVGTLAAVMQGAEPLRRVQADVEDGMALGLYSTPMVFINGVEFKGWQVPGALRKTVQQVLATNPPARTAKTDRPVMAAQRYIDDWKEQPESARPADKRAWFEGVKPGEKPADGSPVVDVIVYGDYQEVNTIALDAQIVEAMKGRTDVRYTFRHYPVDPTVNPALPASLPPGVLHPLAGLAARAAEAAGSVAGSEGYWKMHRWLLANSRVLSVETLREAAKGFGWDVDLFVATLDSPEVLDAIKEDCYAGKSIGLTSIPYVFVNGRLVPRVLRDGDNVVRRVIEEAGRGTGK